MTFPMSEKQNTSQNEIVDQSGNNKKIDWIYIEKYFVAFQLFNLLLVSGYRTILLLYEYVECLTSITTG